MGGLHVVMSSQCELEPSHKMSKTSGGLTSGVLRTPKDGENTMKKNTKQVSKNNKGKLKGFSKPNNRKLPRQDTNNQTYKKNVRQTYWPFFFTRVVARVGVDGPWATPGSSGAHFGGEEHRALQRRPRSPNRPQSAQMNKQPSFVDILG